MSKGSTPILQVVLPVPLRHHFDYLACDHYPAHGLQTGIRVLVPFGKRKQQVGILTGVSSTSEINRHKLKRISKIIDDTPLFDPSYFKLLCWASDYYHYPLGELIFNTLPGLLRNGKRAELEGITIWQLNNMVHQGRSSLPLRAHKQQAILDLLKHDSKGLTEDQLNDHFGNWRSAMNSLLDKGLVSKSLSHEVALRDSYITESISLSGEQHRVFETIRSELDSARRFLLDGITGSGKTEIYLEVVREVVAQGKQALLLVPEIGLTPHFISRIRKRINAHLVVLHSGLSDSERLQAWLEAREGIASVILGTRSAVWTPLKNPGIFIVDEEHDPSYKQQDNFRYSARDIAIMRSNYAGVPVVLGSATPSLESLHNADIDKFKRIVLSERLEKAALPRFEIIDMRKQKTRNALSDSLVKAIKNVLDNNKQVLLFLNRRGYSPILMCHACGWIDSCSRCNLPLTYHKSSHRLICHHCGSQGIPAVKCPECDASELVRIGYGTERLAETLEELFPDATILRIDRDSTRRKGSMQDFVDRINSGEADILVGTQMLAKGHHFPEITLVGIIDADRGLYSADFRASERMAQIITQVSGRAGRASDPGVVILQTHFPDHPLLTILLNHDYNRFARLLMQERLSTNLPPFSYMVLLRAESFEQDLPVAFLNDAARVLHKESAGIEVSGPFPAPIEQRAGKYRFQLLLQANNRIELQKAIRPWITELEKHRHSKKIRWSIDVDPQEIL